MPHVLDIQGERFTLRVDLDDASLDLDVDSTRARYTTLTDVLVDRPGPLRRRGSIKKAPSESALVFGAAAQLVAFQGAVASGATYTPYYGVRQTSAGKLQVYQQSTDRNAGSVVADTLDDLTSSGTTAWGLALPDSWAAVWQLMVWAGAVSSSLSGVTAPQPTNPSFATNTTGWSSTIGSIARDTSTYDSSPASLQFLSDSSGNVAFSTSTWDNTFLAGVTYRISVKAEGFTSVYIYMAVTQGANILGTSNSPLSGAFTTATVDFTPTSNTSSLQLAFTSTTLPFTSATGGWIDSIAVTVVAGAVATAGLPVQASGCVHEPFTGQATFAASTAVAGLNTPLSTTQQASVIGSFLMVTDEGPNIPLFAYRIAAATATTITLERAYAGTATGANKNFVICAVAPMYCTTSIFSNTQQKPNAGVVWQAWNRLVYADTTEGTTSIRYRNRIRWTGLVGSSEGTAPYTGIYAVSSTGYLDLPSQGGTIIRGVSYGSAQLVFMERGLCIVYGSPTYDTQGSLDINTFYPEFRLSGAKSVVQTPFGVFFYNQTGGLYVWDGSGVPREIPAYRNIRSSIEALSTVQLGYYDSHLYVLGTASSSGYLYHIPSARWSRIAGGVSAVSSSVQQGRIASTRAASQPLVGFDGSNVLDLSNVVANPGDASTDSNGTAIAASIQTGLVGPPDVLLRPEQIIVTYKMTGGASGDLALTVGAGLPLPGSTHTWDSGLWDTAKWDAPDTAHTYTTTTGDLPRTSGLVTKVIECSTGRGVMQKVAAVQSLLPNVVEIHSIIVTGAVEGLGGSE